MFSYHRAFTAAAALLACTLAPIPALHAQRSIYIDYPQKKGLTHGTEMGALPSWITTDMEVRRRTEGQTAFGEVVNVDRTYELTRVRGGIEVRPSPYVTFYTQFQDSHALGLPLHAVSANMRDAFDLRQGFVDIHHGSVHLFAGRQELRFGGERLVSAADWTNVGRSFDGFDLRIGNSNRVDIFTASVVTISPTSFDKHGAGLTFHGIDASIVSIPNVHLEPFLFIKAIQKVTSAEGIVGQELAFTAGATVTGKLPAGFCFEANGALQRGSWSNDSIHSGESYAKLYHSSPLMPWKPRIGAEVDFATGNSPQAGRWSTFDQLYAGNHGVFGLTDIFGFENIRAERFNLDVLPTDNLSVLVQGGFLELASTRDNIYTGSGGTLVKAPAGGFASDHLGESVDVSAKYVWRGSIVTNVGVGHYFADSAAMATTGKKVANTIGYFALTYRFRTDRNAVGVR